MPEFAHLLSLTHGLAAALVSIATFYLIGLLWLPRRWQASLWWPDSIVVGLALYVLLCWIATSSRHIPVVYVALIFGAALWGLIAIRFGWLQARLAVLRKNQEMREWLATFGIIYVLAYLLVRPPAGPAVLALPPGGGLDLLTYARYAKELLLFGTANLDFAAFEYQRSPASAFLLAWHSLFYLGDPLNAAVPALIMAAALAGTVTVGLVRSLFGLSWRAAMAVGAIAVCAPMFRWALTTYSLGELLSATCVLYLMGVVCRGVAARCLSASILLGGGAGGTLLFFSARSAIGSPSDVARGLVEAVHHFSPLALLGVPDGLPQADTPNALRAAVLVVIPFVPFAWAAAVWAFRRSRFLGWISSSADRQLASALVIYLAAGVIIGNVAVQAASVSRPARWPAGWRQLNQIGRLPFQTFTLKVADDPGGLSTALAMYYLPGRKAHVIGRGVANDRLLFENVSRQQPMFIQNFACDGVGHGDTVSATGVGCLLMAPPSMTVGVSYPFNRTFLFLDFDRMTSREPGGRWNTQPTLNLRLTADPQRARLDREMHVNFLVHTFLPDGVRPLRLTVRWGRDRRSEVMVVGQQWFSLPVQSDDWTGNRLWTLPIAIDFPDGSTILFQATSLTESPSAVR